MKAGIHPAYNDVKVTLCVRTYVSNPLDAQRRFRVEICAHCHPFFTGRQKLVDTEGRVDRFQKKYANVQTTRKKGNETRPVNA